MISTTKIILHGQYFNNAEAFFSLFGDAWKNVQQRVRKLETRQVYRESGNVSLEAFLKGDEEFSLKLLPMVREKDFELYDSLQKRKVEFVRCRPVTQPLTVYLQWEMHCYRINAAHGEKISLCEGQVFLERFSSFAHHDFMIFDEDLVFVHDYDESGIIQGGWKIVDRKMIEELVYLFDEINSSSRPFQE